MKQRILILLLALVMLVSVLSMGAFAEDMVTDSDYDGIPDALDNDPNSNTFTGKMKSGHDGTTTVSFTMDYRDFFEDNTIYHPNLATASVLGAALAYYDPNYANAYFTFNSAPRSDINPKVDGLQLMQTLGFEDVVDYSLDNYGDDDICEVLLGHHTVHYNDQTKVIVAIWVRGTNSQSMEEWSSNFHMGDLVRFFDEYDSVAGKTPRQKNEDWTRKTNHRGFDVCATRLLKYLGGYVSEHVQPELERLEGAQLTYWITGHSRGAAVGNLMASYLIDEGNEVFAYTFAAPYNTANTEASAEKYDCIFNLVNSNDFIPTLPIAEWGFTRYGKTALVDASAFASQIKSATGEDYSGKYLTASEINTLLGKFVCITGENADRNNPGKILGWREIYVYHCGHTHEGETVGNYQSTTFRERGFLSGPSESEYNGYAIRLRKYSYWQNGICQTPMYDLQVLVELLVEVAQGNTLSGGWNYLTSNKLADKFDFNKQSLIGYATKLTEPHFMDTYSVIQAQINAASDPGARFHTLARYTESNTDGGRPIHSHTYTYVPYEGQEPTCTEDGLGYRYCLCSDANSDYYDDYQKNIVFPAFGHDWGEVEYTWSEDNATCTATVVCLNDSSHVETETVNTSYEVVTPATTENAGLGRYTATFENELFAEQTAEIELAQHRAITVYVVDETDSAQLNAWVWGAAGDLFDAWPGEALTQAGTDKGGHPYYSIRLDATDYGTAIIFNDNNGRQTANLNYVNDAGENDYVVYYINDTYAAFGGSDIWPGNSGVVTTPATCAVEGVMSYTGLLTGAVETMPIPVDPAAHDWAEPTYVWAEDYATCTATRVCRHDAAHVEIETVNAVVNAASYTATFENPAFAAQTKEAIGVTGHNLGLEGAILVNTFIHVPEEYLGGKAVLSYTGLNGEPVTKEVPLSTAALRPVTVNGETIESRTIAIAMPAKNMNTVVTIRLYDAAGNPLKMLCAGALVDSHEYSIQSYLQQVIDNSEVFEAAYPGITELCKVMSDYGSYAQLALDFETDNRKPINYESEIAAVAVSGYDYSTEVGGSGVSYYGASVLLRSETTIRAYFKITGSGSYTASYTDGAQTYTAELVHYKEGSKYYYVDIPNISARRLGEKFTITVKDSSNEENFASLVNYSAYGYAQKVLSSSDDANLKLAVKALYRYGEVAKAFLEGLNNG